MVFLPDRVPSEQLDSSDAFTSDIPFDNKQATITTRRHRWFDPRSSVVPPGQLLRIQFDHKPDYIQISVSGRTDANGRCTVFMGDEGGTGIGPCGGGAAITMPAPQGGIVSIRNVGTTPTYCCVTAIAGYSDPGINITLGS